MRIKSRLATVLLFLMIFFVSVVPTAAADGGEDANAADPPAWQEKISEKIDALKTYIDELRAKTDEGSDEAAALDYLKDTVIPIAVQVMTTLSAIYIALVPLITKLRRAREGFNESAQTSEALQHEAQAAIEKANSAAAEIKALHRELAEQKIINEAAAQNAADAAETLKQILLVGFGSIDELVIKGYAKKIYELAGEVQEDGKQNGEDDKEEGKE